MRTHATHATCATGEYSLLAALESAFNSPSLPTFDDTALLQQPDAHSDHWQERAGILTHDARLPKEIAEAAAVIYCITPPDTIDRNAWQQIMDILAKGLDDFARQISPPIP